MRDDRGGTPRYGEFEHVVVSLIWQIRPPKKEEADPSRYRQKTMEERLAIRWRRRTRIEQLGPPEHIKKLQQELMTHT
jgi:hypothetical protein